MERDYTDYDVADFLEDSAFIAWMKGDDKIGGFWEKWRQEHPEKEAVLAAAQEQYRLLAGFRKIRPQPGDEEAVWQRIAAEIHGMPPMRVHAVKRSWFRRPWWQYAAVLLAVAMASWAGYRQWQPADNGRVVVQAGNGLKEVILPDSTVVVLDRGAQLSYAATYNRHVGLKGTAFFRVSKQWSPASGARPFTIQAGKMQVTVLGTVFSISRRRDSVQVVLQEGSVKAAAGGRAVIMHPGEKLRWSGRGFDRSAVNAQLYMAWKEGTFHFNHTAVGELPDLVKYLYGYDLVIKHEASLPVRYISGRVSAANEEDLWKSLELLLHVRVRKQGNRIVLWPR
ncbi:FecR family protein [Compostibacter hankyongensis]|uniref:FecR protein domain-containing protein n=1 Tax=Compostibacter hankyongensis TaxID=1007089 RepID=A0ABP8G2W3_9BACT